MLRKRALAVVAATAFAVVIGGAAVAAKQPAAPTYYQDVKPILDGRCAGCHFRGGIAPFSLTSYRDARANRDAVAQAVRTRLMPPWHAQRGFRRYLHDPSLTNAQIATIVRWAGRGAPQGDPRRPGRPLPAVGGGVSKVDVRLPMPQAYTPKRRSGGDDYRCFVLDWTPSSPTFVTGADVTPGARNEVHHIIIFLAPPAAARDVERWEAADREPGYGCYGGPSASGEQGLGINFLTGWAPGTAGSDFPAGTGQRIEPGSRLIMQVHYNLESVRPRPDRSTVELNLAQSVERRAVYLPFVDFSWVVARQTFRIPAGRKSVVHSFAGDPTSVVRFLGGFDTTRGFTIHSAALHMHRLGKTARLVLERASGRREVLLSIGRWDFNWQRDYRFAQPVSFEPGDQISIRCTHDNSRANQPVVNGRRAKPRTLTWGEDSSDEMCIGFLYVAER